MGIDFQFIGYAGAPLADESLARCIVQHVRTVTMYRHSKAPLPGRDDFHCIALYEGPDDSMDDEEAEETELSQLAILARELSRVVGKVFWFAQSDHASVGGYALFENAELIDPPFEKDTYVDGEGWRDVAAKKWLAATGTGVSPNDVFFMSFPDTDEPPLRLATDLAKRMTFDRAKFYLSLE